MSLTRIWLVLFSFVFATTLAHAQQASGNFPSKPFRIIVPLAPGGPTDLLARLYASQLERKYKQPAIVENKPGGAQVVGAEIVTKSPPDGYTLLVGANTLAH